MAKKTQKTTTKESYVTNYQFTKFCSFWSVAIAAILYIISGILGFIRWLGQKLDFNVSASLGTVGGVFSLIANILLVVALGIPAYAYVRGKGKSWKVFYWVVITIFTLGIVFGFLPHF